MATIERGVARWTGFAGAPGYSTFYATDGGGLSVLLQRWFLACRSVFPIGVTVTMEQAGDSIDDQTGLINGVWTQANDGPVTGTGEANWMAASGILVAWNTDGIVNGHRVRGRTFLVPCTVGDVSGGNVKSTSVTLVQAASDTLVSDADGHMRIWSRPHGSRQGSSHQVVSATVRTYQAVLRSRRD